MKNAASQGLRSDILGRTSKPWSNTDLSVRDHHVGDMDKANDTKSMKRSQGKVNALLQQDRVTCLDFLKSLKQTQH